MVGEDFYRLKLVQRDQARAEAVIDIMVVVGDFVGQVGDLRFQRRLPTFEKSPANITQFLGIFD